MAAWRFVLCDQVGNPIEHITTVARDKQLQYRLNRPQRCSFTVDASDNRIAGLHTDGYPKLDAGRRTVKCYRQEWDATNGRMAYNLRLFGVVWQLQDVGDEQRSSTAVQIVDPLVRLGRRFTAARVPFTDTDGLLIARSLIDTTNAMAPTGILTTGGRVEATPHRDITFQRKDVFGAIYDLAAAFNGFDFDLVPLDRTDGTLARFDGYAKRGQLRQDAVFGWGTAPHNVKRVERLVDMEQYANSVLGIGSLGSGADALLSPTNTPAGSPTTSPGLQSADGVSKFGLYEYVDTIGDITSQAFLDALVQDELTLRTIRRELVQFVPQPLAGPLTSTGAGPSGPWDPFTGWTLGDTVPLVVGSKLRGGFTGIQRIYGFDLVLDNDGREIVNGIYAQQQTT